MSAGELIAGIVLAVVLVALAGFFGLRQRKTMQLVRANPLLPDNEKDYYRRQALRRVCCSVMMLLFAGMLVGWFFLAQGMVEIRREDEQAKGELTFYTTYWILALLLLLGMTVLAVVDFLATARFGMRQRRQLEQDHQGILEREAARLRDQHQE